MFGAPLLLQLLTSGGGAFFFSFLMIIFVVIPILLGITALIMSIIYLSKASSGNAGARLQLNSYLFAITSCFIGLLNFSMCPNIKCVAFTLLFFLPLGLTIVGTIKQKQKRT